MQFWNTVYLNPVYLNKSNNIKIIENKTIVLGKQNLIFGMRSEHICKWMWNTSVIKCRARPAYLLARRKSNFVLQPRRSSSPASGRYKALPRIRWGIISWRSTFSNVEKKSCNGNRVFLHDIVYRSIYTLYTCNNYTSEI